MQSVNGWTRKCLVQVLIFILFYCVNLGRCTNMNTNTNMMLAQSQGVVSMNSMSGSGRDFADLDAAEAAVPRRPTIRNNENVEHVMFNLNDPNHGSKEITCIISNGVPTPTVLWMKDNQKNLDNSFFTTTFDPKSGIAKLSLVTSPSPPLSSSSPGTGPGPGGPRKNLAKFLSGMYTCYAANFLGHAQKTFQVQVV